jgi:shikimate kinase
MQDLLKGLNIYLIGMMGTGKTTVGKILARKLGYRFFDTDALIEQVASKTINEIFASDGEESFRDLETKVLAELSACTRSAIATGGGIVIRQKNWSYLHYGLIIWLDAPVELLVQRLADDNTRPLKDKLNSLLEQRRPLYNQADLHLTIDSDRTPEQIAAEAIEMIPSVLKTNSNFN